MTDKIKLLFVCSKNQWRSPTAEHIWRKDARVHARSGGTSSGARHRVSEDDIIWSDVIFVMEEKHKRFLTKSFTQFVANKRIVVLDIPDEYHYMDAALVSELSTAVSAALGFDSA
jgi:predicted protein tyrosine phosphatase